MKIKTIKKLKKYVEKFLDCNFNKKDFEVFVINNSICIKIKKP